MKTVRTLRLQLSILALAAFSFAAIARAHEGHHHDAMGTVKAVDAAKLDLETKEGEPEAEEVKLESFVLTDKTIYKRGDDTVTHHDVAVGDRAVVMYEKKDDKNVAIEVKLGAKKKSEPAVPPKVEKH